MHIYVDDPIYVPKGTGKDAIVSATIATVWLRLVGLPLAWHKTEAGLNRAAGHPHSSTVSKRDGDPSQAE